jgi:hypothetical protein
VARKRVVAHKPVLLLSVVLLLPVLLPPVVLLLSVVLPLLFTPQSRMVL